SESGDIEIEATEAASIEALAVAVSIAVALGGDLGIALSGGGSESTNILLRNILAFITGPTKATATSGNVQVNSTDDSTVLAEVGSGSVGAASIGVALARNYIGWEDGDTKGTDKLQASISSSTITARDVVLLADAGSAITARVGAGSVGFAYANKGSALSASGAGVESTNKISTEVKAYIETSSVTATGNVSVQAQDESDITTDAGAASVSISYASDFSGGLTVGVAISKNEIDNDVEAYIDSATQFDVTGNLSIRALETATISSVAVAASIGANISSSGTGVSLSGGGAESTNNILGKSNAYINSTTVTVGGNLNLSAENASDIDAKVAAVSIAVGVGQSTGVGVSIGAAVTQNFIGWTLGETKDALEVKAYISDSSITTTGTHTQTATARQQIDAGVGAGSVGVASSSSGAGLSGSGSGASADNRIAVDVKSYINGDGATGISAASLSLTADDSSRISAVAGAASIAASYGSSTGGSLSIGAALAYNEISNQVDAYIINANQGVTTTSSDLVISATSLGKPLFKIDLAASSLTTANLNDAGEIDDDDDTAIFTKLRNAFDAAGEPLADVNRVWLGAVLSSESGTQDLTTGDQVELATDYANGGQGGRVYKFLAADQANVDLAAENYASTSRWELVKADPKFATVTEDKEWSLVAPDGAAYTLTKIDGQDKVQVSQNTITAISVAASVGASYGGTTGVALSGAGASAKNVILTGANAYIKDSKVDSSGKATLTAQSTSDILATVVAATIAGTYGGTTGVGASI
ncbi:MAG: hypothetical protein QGF59_26495, partial [Pirellulaceae bacterium]|nr:hypothetical protein [Pirellulaceae bacterium]